MAAHLSTDCPAVTICCPNPGCGCEVARNLLPGHLQTCEAGVAPRPTAEQTECPWGCGLLCSSGAELEQHKADCLMEPRKLLAAIHKLHAENVRLDTENQSLRQQHIEVEVGSPRKRPFAATAQQQRPDDMSFS